MGGNMTIKEFMELGREKGKKVLTLKDRVFFATLIAILLMVTILSGIANPATIPSYLTL